MAKNLGDAAELLSNWGFEFEWYGAGNWGVGWKSNCAYGFARGQLPYMKGTLCEAYPEVTDYWLSQVERYVAMGFDGVDIRLQNHSGMVSDYSNLALTRRWWRLTKKNMASTSSGNRSIR